MTDHYEESLDIKILAAERDALEARAERLAEALLRYGVHAWECTAMDIPICTCGLDAALAMGDAPKPDAVTGPVDVEALREGVEYEYEVWQDGALQAGGRELDYASAKSEARHYAMMYSQDGPVEVRIYEKRLLLTTAQARCGS